MSFESFIQDFRKDPNRWRPLARQLLRYNAETLPQRNIGFLESISEREWQEELSYLQAEWLLDIERDVKVVSEYRGYSVITLIKLCFENRFDLEDDDHEWVEDLHRSGLKQIRRYEAIRVFKLVKQLGEIEGD